MWHTNGSTCEQTRPLANVKHTATRFIGPCTNSGQDINWSTAHLSYGFRFFSGAACLYPLGLLNAHFDWHVVVVVRTVINDFDSNVVGSHDGKPRVLPTSWTTGRKNWCLDASFNMRNGNSTRTGIDIQPFMPSIQFTGLIFGGVTGANVMWKCQKGMVSIIIVSLHNIFL